jgi:hypothetical protein
MNNKMTQVTIASAMGALGYFVGYMKPAEQIILPPLESPPVVIRTIEQVPIESEPIVKIKYIEREPVPSPWDCKVVKEVR